MKNSLMLTLLIFLTKLTCIAQADRHWMLNDKIHLEFTSNGLIQINCSQPYYSVTAGWSIINAVSSWTNSEGDLQCFSNSPTVEFNINCDTMLNSGGSFIPFFNPTSNILTLLSDPGNANQLVKVYCRVTGLNSPFNFYNVIRYIDMTGDNGLGEALPLMAGDSTKQKEYFMEHQAVLHGNGVDWWILNPMYNPAAILISKIDAYGIAIVDTDSVFYPFVEDTIALGCQNFEMAFSKNGDKVALSQMDCSPQNVQTDTYSRALVIADFDRCEGKFSNPRRIQYDYFVAPFGTDSFRGYYTLAFSPSGRFIYASDYMEMYQLDLSLPDSLIESSKVLLYKNPYSDYNDPNGTGCNLITDIQLAPDGKIYVALAGCLQQGNEPEDSLDYYLHSIENPDSFGLACNFTQKSFYLNGERIMRYFPPVPIANPSPMVIPGCDTLTSIHSGNVPVNASITIFPNPAQTQATLAWSGVAEGTFALRDMLGRAVMSEQLNTPSGTTRLDLSTLPKGIYLWQVQSAEYFKNGKLVVE
jgi:hypothetical protein